MMEHGTVCSYKIFKCINAEILLHPFNGLFPEQPG